MQNKRKMGHRSQGQASVEYLLTLSAVFIAFAGVSIFFSDQVGRYLSFLFDMIQAPF